MLDYSILPLLSETLNISINELLSRERLNEEIYQKKLEENIIINVDLLKKRMKKMIRRILYGFFIVIVSLLIAIGIPVGYKNMMSMRLKKTSKDFDVTICKQDNVIWLKIESKKKQLFGTNESASNCSGPNCSTFYFDTYYQPFKKDYHSSYIVRAQPIYSDIIEKIYFNRKLIYEKGMNLEICEGDFEDKQTY